jgi:hypothetical protein
MTFRGRIKNGQIALDQPASLPEGAEVKVEILENDIESQIGAVTVWNDLLKLAGTAEGLPSDAARSHDRYLYDSEE